MNFKLVEFYMFWLSLFNGVGIILNVIGVMRVDIDIVFIF